MVFELGTVYDTAKRNVFGLCTRGFLGTHNIIIWGGEPNGFVLDGALSTRYWEPGKATSG